ncbi:MAG: hypothetical protein R3F60_14890 [bacterium]
MSTTSALVELRAILAESAAKAATEREGYCRWVNGRIECPPDGTARGAIEQYLVGEANATFGQLRSIPGVSPVLDGLLGWASAKGMENRRARLIENVRQRARDVSTAVWRVLWLLVEDDMRRQGFGPLLAFVGSEAWLTWGRSELARNAKAAVARLGAGRGPRPTWAQQVEAWRERAGLTPAGGVGWAPGLTSLGDDFTRYEERLRLARRVPGGEAWVALNLYMVASMPVDPSRWTPPAELVEHAALAELVDRLPAGEGVQLRDQMVRAFAFIAFLVSNGGRALYADAGKRMIQTRYAAELGYLDSPANDVSRVGLAGGPGGPAAQQSGAERQAAIPSSPSPAQEKPSKPVTKPKPAVPKPSKPVTKPKKKTGGGGLLLAGGLAVAGVAGVALMRPKRRKR